MTIRLGFCTLILLSALTSPSIADPSVSASISRAAATYAESEGVFIRMDGSYQMINLPALNLGWVLKTPTDGAPIGPSQNFNPRTTGYGAAGAIGYSFRDGTFAPAFGSNVRVELGLSYIDANATDSTPGIPGAHLGLQHLDGSVIGNVQCGPACQANPSTFTTDYRSWQVNLKGESDFHFGAVTLTPSVAVFTGDSRNRQNLAQQFINTAVGANLGTYNVASSLNWTDWGAKFGLKTRFDVTQSLALGLGGSIGLAARDMDLSASDAVNSGGFFTNTTSTLARGADTTAFLANAEASITARLWSGLAVRGFAGLNYDSHVPGISAPTYATLPTGTGTTGVTGAIPAGINFQSTTSYYFGGGLTFKFNPDNGAIASAR